MKSRYRISVGGTHLDNINDKIWILDIQYPPPEIEKSIDNPAGRDGGIITKKTRRAATVTVTFGLYIYDTAERNAVCQEIKTWAAAGGTLKTNDKPGLALYNAVCDQYPDIESAKNWTDPLTVVFSAYDFPYWEEMEKTEITLKGTNTSGTINIPGNAGDVRVEATVTTQAAISWFELSAGDTKIRVNKSIANGKTITISYTKDGIMRIREGSTSILDKRSAESNDDLLVTSGERNAFRIKASGKIKVDFSTRGAWL